MGVSVYVQVGVSMCAPECVPVSGTSGRINWWYKKFGCVNWSVSQVKSRKFI